MMEEILPPRTFKKRTNAVKTTQHTLLSFLPARLCKEFMKSYNLFFLFLCCIVSIPSLTPFSNISYITCVLMVVSVNIIKTSLGEIKRYRADQRMNTQLLPVIRKGKITETRREDINNGDILVFAEGEVLPVDVLLLGAYTEKGAEPLIYIETSSIDGESALKVRRTLFMVGASKALGGEDFATLEGLEKVSINREAEQGTCFTIDSSIPFSKENLIYKGSSIYGKYTSLGLSLGGKNTQDTHRIKNSIFMKVLARKTVSIIFLYLSILLLSSFASCLFITRSAWISSLAHESLSRVAVRNFAANIIIFSSLVPLSLFVTLDGLRIAYSVYIRNDREMRYNDTPCESNMQGVVEDIGLLTHVLTDKTGTLTQNQMIFKGLHFKNQIAPLFFDGASLKKMLSYDYALMNVLALVSCHSVDVFDGVYRGVSQEEVSILTLFKEKGIFLSHRQNNTLYLEIGEETLAITVLEVLPFSPALSRMSVLVQIGGFFFLFTKGSEEVVDSQGALSVDGKYRALTVAMREVSVDEVLNVPRKEEPQPVPFFQKVTVSDLLKNQPTSLSSYAPSPGFSLLYLEPGQEYIGTAYIEDVLQPNAGKTIETIKARGISVWMLTGDRKESAISCGASTSILSPLSKIHSGTEVVRLLEGEVDTNTISLGKETGVIVYRTSPQEKQQITHLLRKQGNIVLTIGDGENDVGMIEEADVGICVIGKEGRKAAFVSDIIVPTFSSLSKLVDYHGRICLERLKGVYFFYVFKSISVAMCQCFYGLQVGSSGSIASSSLFLLFYNGIITSPLSVELGLFREQSVVRTMEEAVLSGALYGLSSFFIVYLSFGSIDVIDALGRTAGHGFISRVFSLCIFVSTLLHFIFISDSFVAFSLVSVTMSCLFFSVSIGMDGGYDIFLSPSLYVILLLRIVTGIAIERFMEIVRNRKVQSCPPARPGIT
ncbi:phospholipid-transporting ATPase [Nematocida displodere]|uniref:Phospholipid-transporting ATPase n=1 Tax=Nematocida displodere TaxID=1805483 RepID=A0A177EC54_9MICR|nr:phospholipid-transporting ATPase [Nematocida displodere]